VALRIELIAICGRRLFFRISEVQFGVTALCLEHIGAFAELSRLALVARLVFALAGRWLILSVSVVVRHELFPGRRSFGDFEPPSSRHVLRRRGHRDLQHTVPEARFCLIGNRAFGQRDHSLKGPVTSLGAIHSGPFVRVFTMSFTLNRDRIVSHIHFDVILAQARQVCPDHEFAVSVEHFNAGRPQVGVHTPASLPSVTDTEVVEDSIDFIGKPLKDAARLWIPTQLMVLGCGVTRLTGHGIRSALRHVRTSFD